MLHGRRMDFSIKCAYAHGTSALRTHLINMTAKQTELTWPVFAALRKRWAGKVRGYVLLQPALRLMPGQGVCGQHAYPAGLCGAAQALGRAECRAWLSAMSCTFCRRQRCSCMDPGRAGSMLAWTMFAALRMR